MSTFTQDEKIQVWLVDDIADITAPSLGEITAGDEITRFLRSLTTPLEANVVDSSTAESKFNKTTSGTYGGQAVTGTFTRDDVYADDLAWHGLERGRTTHLVICDRGGSGAAYSDNPNRLQLANGDRVDVWTIEVTSRQRGDYSRNELATFTFSASVPEVPAEDVAIGGS